MLLEPSVFYKPRNVEINVYSQLEPRHFYVNARTCVETIISWSVIKLSTDWVVTHQAMSSNSPTQTRCSACSYCIVKSELEKAYIQQWIEQLLDDAYDNSMKKNCERIF